MAKSKYNLMVPVCWRDILKSLEWCLTIRKLSAELAIDAVQNDLAHNFPDLLEDHVRRALGFCELVFYQYEQVNSIRTFLKYKPKTAQQLGIQFCYDFYLAYKNPSLETACRPALKRDTETASK